jgi:hypothetical protein
MPAEQRGQAIRVMIALVNWQQEEPNGCGGGQQLLLNGTSRVNREIYARFCERLGVKFPGPTRRTGHLVLHACKRYPQLQGAVLDLPGAIAIGREYVERSPCANRIELIAGDFFLDPLPEADLFAFGRIF